MRILLHTCCAPCATVPIRALQSDSHNIVAYFHNPNIHPATEFANRLASVLKLTEEWGIERIIDSAYRLDLFLGCIDGVEFDRERCARCYAMRLRRTAEMALERGFDAFSTSLLVSPYQKHELIMSAGEEAADEYGIAFHYEDYRADFPKTREIAGERGLYRQKYCGCIFSESERYAGRMEKLVWKARNG